jgi:ABC-type branched-subunit amino acid transport system substrate-binding protein
MKTFAALLAALAMAVSVGCTEQQSGPAEKAGKEIDQAVEKAGQETQSTLEKAGDYTSEKVDQAGEQLEQAGEKMQE